MKPNLQGVGIAWYRREDYDALRALMADRDGIPVQFDDWERFAEKGLERFKSQDITVMKVYLDLERFPAWCRERGFKEIGADARRLYAAFVVKEMAGEAKGNG